MARVVGIAGLGAALASLLLTWYLWRRSGAALKITINARRGETLKARNHQYELWVVTVDVRNTGRIPTVVGNITVAQMASRWALSSWLRLWPKLFRNDWAIGKTAKPVDGDLPKVIEPTGYLEAEATLESDTMDSSSRWLRAIVSRGDGKTAMSPVILTPRDQPVPRALRKMRKASEAAWDMDTDE